jgi:hypothetical protein
MSKYISHAADGLDVIGATIRITELLSDFAYMHIDTSIKGRKFSSQYSVDKMFASHNPASFPQ